MPRLITKNQAEERIADALRMYSGRGKLWSVADLADELHITPNTLDNWRNGQCLPTADALLRLMQVLPQGFRDAVIPASDTPEVCVDTAAVHASDFVNTWVAAKADNVVTPKERSVLLSKWHALKDLFGRKR